MIRALLLFLLLPLAAFAQDPGATLLTIAGSRLQSGADKELEVNMAWLRALPQQSIRTSTIWTHQVDDFQGVLLRDLVAAVGTLGGSVRLQALDGYEVTIPLAELGLDAPVLAYLRNGQPMSVRERGPIWVLYPFDTHPEYRNETTYGRAIWQVTRISFVAPEG
ncbi:oxidoreductase [Rhodobacter sp. KR11]|uniref:oxidoreductase n=1 Tax=Rhodobacter sp. KR11 TaxID=2974588 RepID=UPI0022212FB0|nr:oxidoreductase [Rhodobacter sp. KR11]MCW1920546.1 oxidoreductase [Rhodobacter sp. KR11]